MKSRKTKGLIFWTTILLAALIIPLQFAQDAHAAISYVDSASNPADDGNQTDEIIEVTPPSMQQGDFVLLIGANRTSSGTVEIYETGGQSWTSLTQNSYSLMKSRLFYCIFNGTWTANPSIHNTNSNTNTKSAIMHVFRGVDQTTPIDYGEELDGFSSSEEDKTIGGITTNTDGAWVIAVWAANWTGTWTLSTSGWTNAGLARYNNHGGGSNKLSVSAARKAVSPAGGSGDVTNTTDAGDGTTHIFALKPAAASAPLEQEGFRFRYDNGSESTATWLESQDTDIARDKNLNTRLRVLVKATGDPASQQYQLEYKKSTDGTYSKVLSGTLPTYVGAGGLSATSEGYLNIWPTLPAGIQTNDILLMFVESANEAVSISDQAGGTWTEAPDSPQGFGASPSTDPTTRLTVFWSRYNGTQTTPTVTGATDHAEGKMIAIRGVITSGNPFDVTAGGTETTSDTSGSIPGDTTTVNNTMVVVATTTSFDPANNGSAEFDGWSNSDLANLTERIDEIRYHGNGGGFGVATGEKASDGSYGTTSVTLANAGYKAMWTGALKPDPGTGAILISASSNIAASGANTTAQLNAPDGKTTSDFIAGRIQDDENPADAVDIADGYYTELEWCLIATDAANYGDVYQFRVTANGTPLDSYSVTPQWTITKAIYYSVGTDTSDLYSGNAEASNGVLTLTSYPAALKIGIGDEIRMGTNCSATESCYYITGRNSSTEFTIQNSSANGGTPGDTNITFSSTPIKIRRAFNKLSDAEVRIRSASSYYYLRTGDLVNNKYQLNWACYADGAMTDSALIDGDNWTTGPDNYIRIFTPTSTSQVGISQRHNGTLGTGFTMTPGSGSSAIQVSEDYVRIEGIAISSANSSAISVSNSEANFSINNDVRISHCLLTGTGTARALWASDSNGYLKLTIWNTIAHNFGGRGFYFASGTAYCYNCTAYNNNYSGFQRDGGTVVLKNCISMGHTTYDYVGSFDGSSDYNMSSASGSDTLDIHQAPAANAVTGTTLANTTETTVYVDSTDNISAGMWFINYTVRKSAKIDSIDSSNKILYLSEPITGQAGAGQSYKVMRSAWYRSALDNFVSSTNLHLKEGAEAINVGTSLSGTFTGDIDGEMRSGTWDMGADEYFPATPFQYRKPLTFKYSERGGSCGTTYDLSYYPVLVSLSNKTYLKTVENGGHVYSPAGYDIIFRDSDGRTQLPHEIEKYDGETGTLVAWVQIPDLFADNKDTTIYMYYGNYDITTKTENPAGVWNVTDNGYARVFHLNGNANDSTATYNGNVSGATFTSDGKFAGAFSFDGNDYIDTNYGPNYGGGNFSVELWYNETSCSNCNQYMVGSRVASGSGAGVVMHQQESGSDYFVYEVFNTSGGSDDALRSGTFFDNWHYVVLTRSGNNVTGYMDNLATVPGGTSGSVDLNGKDYYIGVLGTNNDPTAGTYFNGTIDEVRFSTVARQPCWIETTYNSMSSPDDFVTEGEEEGAYENKRQLTINYNQRDIANCGSSYNLQNFPVLVKLEGAWLKWKEIDSTNGRIYSEYGHDIIFKGPDDSTQLPHEIEEYYPGTAEADGRLIAWVKIPDLFAGNQNTTIYMYYGSSAVTEATENPPGVWTNDYAAVYHLKETSGTQHSDSTGNGNNSTSVSVAEQGSATGKIDGADDFSGGTSSNITIADKTSQHITDAITIEAWIDPDDITSDKGRIVNKSDSVYVLRSDNQSSGKLHGYVYDAGGLKEAAANSILTTGSYQHVAMTWDGLSGDHKLRLYHNGSEVSSYTMQQSPASPLNTSTGNLYIGSYGGTEENFNGRIDEVRISNVARDACWLGTTYNSMNNPITIGETTGFITLGEEGATGGGGGGAPTGIKLSSFSAWGEGSAVQVQWETKTEVDNLGFNLYRSTERDGTYTKLNSSLIPGLLSSVKGKRYSFTDANVTKGKIYYYKLEDMDLKGKSTVHGPVCVDWDRDGIPDDEDRDVRISDSGTGGGSGAGGSSGGGETSDGDFWVYGDSTVTRVSLKEFKAHETPDGVLVEWQTGFEVNNLGFHLYREVDGKVVRLTPEMVAGSALLAGSGTSLRAGYQYRWLDNSLLRTQDSALSTVLYWLEDVDLSGKRTWHGPVEVQLLAPGSSLSASDSRRAELMSEFGKKLNKKYEEFWKIQDLKEKLRKNVNRYRLLGKQPALSTQRSGLSTSSPGANVSVLTVDDWNQTPAGRIISTPLSDKPPKVFPAVQQALASGPAVKLLVKEDGWYRVSRSELQGAGLRAGVNPQFLRLYTEGVEVPLGVVSEKQGNWVSWEAIEFYGVGVDTPSTDTRVYWLVEGRQPGKRLEWSPGQGGQTGASSFPYTVEKKDRLFYFAALKNGDESNFFGPIINQAPADQNLEVRHLDLGAWGDATLEVRIQGVTVLPHQVKISINEIEIGTLSWEGQTLKMGVFSVPQSYLLEGENLVTLVAVGGETDVSLLDSIHLTYWRTYRAHEDELKCQAQGGTQVSIDGFNTPEVRVFDITDAGGFFEVETKGKAVDTGYRVTFRVPGSGTRTLLALTDQRMKTPAGVRANQPSSWRMAGGYDLVIVSHGDFIGSLASLEALRRSEGLSVGVVDIEDVYDEFNFGMKSPQALKDFLSHARSSWSRPPSFVLLVGDASFDPRNYLGFGSFDLVPTKLVETKYLETASDDWFTDFSGDGLPELAVGRLPVRTVEEASIIVSKIVGYGQSAQRSNEVLLVADMPGEDFDFEKAGTELFSLFPQNIKVWGISRVQFANDMQVRTALMQNLNAGNLMVNYVGHGSVEVWRGNIFAAADAERLSNGSRLAFFVNMTCLNGFFQDVYTTSLAEELLKAPGGGAVAVWASSGLTEPDKQLLMNKALIRLLFNGEGLTIGEAAMRAKAATGDQDIRRTWVLFGDPSTKLKD